MSRFEDCMQNVGRWADRIKILVWDRTGLVLVHKRLEGCKFVWPTIADGVMRISPAMFAALFEGLDRSAASTGRWITAAE
uniref:IS66 family insertion sequence element accessory protein TnpB n=1 Tax=Bradyrhizobium septentrionale TaxID=1404411 RepID=A0A974A036_9BRAD